VITLPLIYALDAGADPAIAQVLDAETPDEDRITWAVEEVRRAGGSARAIADAQRYIAQAVDQLHLFPDSLAKQALVDIASSIVATSK
jgi:geranylgeranyl pyrophosphate synthase